MPVHPMTVRVIPESGSGCPMVRPRSSGDQVLVMLKPFGGRLCIDTVYVPWSLLVQGLHPGSPLTKGPWVSYLASL